MGKIKVRYLDGRESSYDKIMLVVLSLLIGLILGWGF